MQTWPIGAIDFPRPITVLHQVELSSLCNLRCAYCPSPNLSRPKVHISRAHFLRALAHVRHYLARGGHPELNLTGIGESTIHPEFPDLMRLAREAVGPNVHLTCPTNGIAIDRALVAAVRPYDVRFCVSLHQPKHAARAVRLLQDAGLLELASADFACAPNDWAGQVDWLKPSANADGFQIPCPWLRAGWAMVLADGRITTCCLDASGAGVVGHVDDEVGSIRVKPYELCRGCYQDIGAAGWDQRAGRART